MIKFNIDLTIYNSTKIQKRRDSSLTQTIAREHIRARDYIILVLGDIGMYRHRCSVAPSGDRP